MSATPSNFPIFEPRERYGFKPGDLVGYHFTGSGGRSYLIPARVAAEDGTTGALIVRHDDDGLYGEFLPQHDQVVPLDSGTDPEWLAPGWPLPPEVQR
jgi:hypothetical protein